MSEKKIDDLVAISRYYSGSSEISLPLTAIDDFEKLGRIAPCFRELHRMLEKNNFIWLSEAEKLLLEHARPV